MHQPTPSEGHAIGIAMSPSVLRDGALKSHILLNAHYVATIHDPEHENFDLALHTIAHECVHVEITTKFDTAFPVWIAIGNDPVHFGSRSLATVSRMLRTSSSSSPGSSFSLSASLFQPRRCAPYFCSAQNSGNKSPIMISI